MTRQKKHLLTHSAAVTATWKLRSINRRWIRMSYNKLLAGIISYSLLACAVCGCAAAPETTTESSKVSSVSDSITYLDAADMFTKRDKQSDYTSEDATEITLSDSKSTCNSPAVRISDNQITITRTGTYVLSGSLTNGQIVVDASGEKVQIVLKDASINCDTSAAIYVKSADKVFVTLAENTSNTLTNTKDFVAIDDNNIDAVIFSKSDLSLNGSGTLTIHAAYGHGIVSKDDLVITSGTYDITAARHALSGKDSVRIADGVFTLNAKKDGIHSENTDNDEKGFIYIADGTFSITCDSDGMDAEETLQVDGGTITIAAGDDGLHADGDLVLNDGTITITKSYEGLEGKTVTITGGSYAVTSSDDGVNAAGDGTAGDSSDSASSDSSKEQKMPSGTPPKQPQNSSDSTEMPQPPQNGAPNGNGNPGPGGIKDATDYNRIQISGGMLTVNADGDGLDSNGDLTVTGGEIYIDGPVQGGNGALDCSGTATISDGTVIAVGSSGMAENFSSSSTQGSMLVTVSASMISGEITLQDSNGNSLLSYTPAKSYNSVVISCPKLTSGETYTLLAGDTTTTVTLDSIVKSVKK